MFDTNSEKYAVALRDGVDTVKILGVKYIGDEESGTVEAAATTSDLTLKHGDLSSEAVDSTVGASGVLDLTTYDTLYKVLRAINASPNWEAWAIDVPGDYAMNISAGNGILPTVTAQQAKVNGGYEFLQDTSLKTAEDFSVGVTKNGQSSNPHAHDGMWKHQVTKLIATATFGGATDGIYVYECDDLAGTKVLKDHLTLVTATLTTWGDGSAVLWETWGKRLVFMAKDASGAITVPKFEVTYRSVQIGPGLNAKHMLCQQ